MRSLTSEYGVVFFVLESRPKVGPQILDLRMQVRFLPLQPKFFRAVGCGRSMAVCAAGCGPACLGSTPSDHPRLPVWACGRAAIAPDCRSGGPLALRWFESIHAHFFRPEGDGLLAALIRRTFRARYPGPGQLLKKEGGENGDVRFEVHGSVRDD